MERGEAVRGNISSLTTGAILEAARRQGTLCRGPVPDSAQTRSERCALARRDAELKSDPVLQ